MLGAREGGARGVDEVRFPGFRGCAASGSLASLGSLISGSTQVSGGRSGRDPTGRTPCLPVGSLRASPEVPGLVQEWAAWDVVPSHVPSCRPGWTGSRDGSGTAGRGANGLVSRPGTGPSARDGWCRESCPTRTKRGPERVTERRSGAVPPSHSRLAQFARQQACQGAAGVTASSACACRHAVAGLNRRVVTASVPNAYAVTTIGFRWS